MATATLDEVTSGFETNTDALRPGRKRAGVDPSSPSQAGRNFREFLATRQARSPKYVPPEEPTAERKAKPDKPKKTPAGFYRSAPQIERLRDRNALDKDPRIADAMCRAATRLYEDFYESGLGGISGQDLSREIRGGGVGTVASHMPKSERAMHHRQRFRQACHAMGWHVGYPHRGCGRIVVDVCCFELPVADAAKLHVGKGRDEAIKAAGIDRLREGLFILAKHWRLI